MPSSSTPITFITSNPNKLSEVQAIMAERNEADQDGGDTDTDIHGNNGPVALRSQSVDIVEIQAGTIEEIAIDKCRRAADAIKGPVLTEDTGLSFRALNGLPGPYIKWFLQAIGHQGLNNLLAAHEDKTAEAVTTFAFCKGPGEEVLLFQGRLEIQGKIVPARGPLTFGWDPIFEYNGQTYAEMEKADKNKISHRYLALQKLKTWLIETNGGVSA